MTAITTITFNGQAQPQWLIINESPLQAAPPISGEYMDIPNRPGSYRKSKKIEGRPLPYKVTVLADNAADLHTKMEALAAWLHTDEEDGELIDSNQPDRIFYASWEGGNNFGKEPNIGEGELSFFCQDPLKKAQADVTQTLSGADSYSVTNNGGYAAKPVFTVTFSGSAPEIRIENADGQFVRVVRNFVLGDVLTIDHVHRKITLNGETIMPALDLFSTFFSLSKGANTLNFTAAIPASTELSYRERYL